MYLSSGYPGSNNDHSCIRADKFLQSLRGLTRSEGDGQMDGSLFSNHEYEMLDEDEESVTHTGAFLICDGGYSMRPSLIQPFKETTTPESRVFNTAIESVRKGKCLSSCVRERSEAIAWQRRKTRGCAGALERTTSGAAAELALRPICGSMDREEARTALLRERIETAALLPSPSPTHRR